MLTDQMIDAELAPLRPVTRQKVPFAADWVAAPFPDLAVAGRTIALLADGLGVDRDSGEVLALQGELVPVNESLGALVASAGVYGAASREAATLDDDDVEALADLVVRARAAVALVDDTAVAHDEQPWALAAARLA